MAPIFVPPYVTPAPIIANRIRISRQFVRNDSRPAPIFVASGPDIGASGPNFRPPRPAVIMEEAPDEPHARSTTNSPAQAKSKKKRGEEQQGDDAWVEEHAQYLEDTAELEGAVEELEERAENVRVVQTVGGNARWVVARQSQVEEPSKPAAEPRAADPEAPEEEGEALSGSRARAPSPPRGCSKCRFSANACNSCDPDNAQGLGVLRTPVLQEREAARDSNVPGDAPLCA